MQCGDLERYLEAFLDGRLGRSRSAILRRHLALCGGCRARIERLRQFERDMQRRFRSMSPDQSIWRGLELDLVASGRGNAGHLLALPRALPDPSEELGRAPSGAQARGRHPILADRGNARGRSSRLAGVVLVAMALGALYQLAQTHLAPIGEAEAAARAYQELQREDGALALRSEDPAQLEAWLATELGTPVPLPPTPAGYRPLGADRASLGSGTAGVVLYGREADLATAAIALFVQPAEAAVPASGGGEPADRQSETGLRELSWTKPPFRYTLVGDRPAEELRRFVN